MKLKKIMAAAMALTVVCGAQTAVTAYQPVGGITANAADILDSGKCGDNVTWQVDSEGTLTISGKGEVAESPWDDSDKFDKESVKKLIIKEGVTAVYGSPFLDLTNIGSISIPDSSFSLDGISSGTFRDTKWFENEKAKGSFVILNGYLLDGSNCKGEVIIPNTVKHIVYMAFAGNEDITSVTIPDSVTSIGSGAFADCKNLEKVSGGSSLNSCGNMVFMSTKWLESERAKNPLVILQHTLIKGSDCSGNVTIPDNVTNIAVYAFELSAITSVTIPKSVTSIGYGAFYCCENLESAIIYNPECFIHSSPYTFFSDYGNGQFDYVFNGVIKGYKGSTAEAYAKKNGYSFDEIVSETTTTATTTTTTTTTATTTEATTTTTETTTEATTTEATTTAPETTTEPITSTVTAPVNEVSFGDPTGDGKIDAKDASFTLVEYAKLSTGGESSLTDAEKNAADVNKDGKVDSKDASTVLQYYAYTSTGGTNPIEVYLGYTDVAVPIDPSATQTASALPAINNKYYFNT